MVLYVLCIEFCSDNTTRLSTSTHTENNPVLLGYDVVQYHMIPSVKEGGVAVRGVPELAFNWQGYQFWFSTVANRDLFRSHPQKVRRLTD